MHVLRKALIAEMWGSSRLITICLVLQIVVILGAAGVAAKQYPTWSLDEGAHFDYVSYVASEHRLPILGPDRVHDEVIAISYHRYPEPSGAGDLPGILGASYEAFQSPLYYLLVAPAWHASGNWIRKVHVIRAMGVVFLLLTIAVITVLCRIVFGRLWRQALVFALLPCMAPGFLLRSVTIGNGALEPLVVALFVLLVVLAVRQRGWRWLLAAAIALGACLLTRLVLGYLVPVFLGAAVCVWWHSARTRADLARTAAIAVVPGVLMLPWLVFNRVHYGAWTASGPARAMQIGIINPTGKNYGIWDVFRSLPGMTEFFTPQEWGTFLPRVPVVPFFGNIVVVVVVPLAVVLMIVLGRSAIRGPGAALCLAPLPLAVIALEVSTTVADWPQTITRYVTGTLPLFAVGAFGVYVRLFGRSRALDRFVIAMAVMIGVALIIPFWSAFVNHQWTV